MTSTLPAKTGASAISLLAAMCLPFLQGCLEDPDAHSGHDDEFSQTLFVASAAGISSFDIATGNAKPGDLAGAPAGGGMMALEDGTLLVHLGSANKILAFDGKTMLEKSRIDASGIGATRPVHSYVSPLRNGKQYWLALNDGDGTKATNSARFVNAVPTSADFLKAAGETPIGIGHHIATFSATGERVVISNAGDCDDILSVYDYSDIADIKLLAKLDATGAGFDGSEKAKTCDQTRANGIAPSPHGCATSKAGGKAYCNLTGNGNVVVVDLDASTPGFSLVTTGGLGGGYTAAHPAGRYVYSLQTAPREAHAAKPGNACQVGQIAVLDGTTDKVVKELPFFYKGPNCTDSLGAGDEKSVGPDNIVFAGNRAYVNLASGFGNAAGRARYLGVLDVTDPADPRQLVSIAVGASNSHHAVALSGDKRHFFVANNSDGTVTHIDAETGNVVRTLTTGATPSALATFGSKEGPSHRTGPFE